MTEETYDTSRFQRDNVTPENVQRPTPPPGYRLYKGPHTWQKLPEGSLFWGFEAEGEIGTWVGGSPVTAVPGGNHHYAVPINVIPPPNPASTPICEPDILEEARQLIHGDRAASYGEAKASFARIAKLWSAYKGVEITPKDVASLMILLKMSRSVTSNKRDNWLDTIGYAALGSELESNDKLSQP